MKQKKFHGRVKRKLKKKSLQFQSTCFTNFDKTLKISCSQRNIPLIKKKELENAFQKDIIKFQQLFESEC